MRPFDGAKMRPRTKWILAAIVTAAAAFVLLPREQWKRVEVPNDVAIRELLTTDIYSPFDREMLLGDPLASYGEPHHSGSESKGKDYVCYKEYLGKHGRVRVYDEAYQGEDGWESARWLVVYPGKLYLDDVVNKKYLTDVDPVKGKWKLSLVSQDRSRYLTLELDGVAITEIADTPR